MSALDLTTARWRKSSRSTNTGNCVELATAVWRKSSQSSNTSNCVELALPSPAAAIRDSKNPDGPTLVFPESALPSLLTHVR